MSNELFISYASADLAFSEDLYQRLTDAEFSVWFDKQRLESGFDWRLHLRTRSETARAVLVILTPRWRNSWWTRFEAYGAEKVFLLHCDGTFDECLTPPLRRWQAADFRDGHEKGDAFSRLTEQIRAHLATPPPEKATRLHHIALPPTPHFVGREDDLNRIHEELHLSPTAALTQGRTRALAAQGGVGKTTLVREYVERFWRLYHRIFWVDARLGFETGFAEIHDQLWPDRAHSGAKDAEKAANALRELQRPAQPGERDTDTLLILDNAEDEPLTLRWIPKAGPCRTLITSRYAGWSAAIKTIHLHVLEPEPARQLLINITTRQWPAFDEKERAATNDLARELGYLPLALEQAAAYIAAQGYDFTFAEYLDLYHHNQRDLLAREFLRGDQYPDSVATTWAVTIAKLTPAARAILRISAFMAETPIPLALYKNNIPRLRDLAADFPAPPGLQTASSDDLFLRTATADLKRYSLATSEGQSVTFHNLLQLVEQLNLHRDEWEKCWQLAMELWTVHCPEGAHIPETWAIWKLAAPHAAVLFQHHELSVGGHPRTQLASGLAGYYWAQGNYPPAIRYARWAAKEDEAEFGLDSLHTLESRNLLGNILGSAGHHQESLQLLRENLDKRRGLHGERHGLTFISMANLASALSEEGKHSEAVDIARRAYHGMKQFTGAEHRQTLISGCCLAASLLELGSLDEAETLLVEVREKQERTLGPDHPDTLATASSLAVVLARKGDVVAAEPLYRRVLEAEERTLGSEHPRTLNSIHNLGAFFQTKGDLAAAEPLFRRAFETKERTLGPDHPKTLISMVSLASVLKSKGDIAAAETLFRRALEAQERVLGLDHANTINTVSNLAVLLHHKGDLSGAALLYRRALEYFERTLGVEHSVTLAAVKILAALFQAKGDLSTAEPFFRRALEGLERTLGVDHPDTLNIREYLANLLRELKDFGGAEALYRKIIESKERTLGPDHSHTLISVNNLAALLQAKGDISTAAPLFRRALEGLERALGTDHPETLNVRENLANLLREQKDFAGAEPLYRKIIESKERTLGPDHPHTLATVNRHAQLLQSNGDLDAAEPLFRRALEARERTLGPEHSDTLISVNNLAALLQAKGDISTVAPLFRRAFEGLERTLGTGHPDTLNVCENLARLLSAQKDFAKLELLYRESLDAQERSLGCDHEITLNTGNKLAGLLQSKGDHSGAEPLFRRALEAKERTLGPEHPATLEALHTVAFTLQQNGDLAQAESTYRRLLERRERILGAEHADTLATVANLGNTLRDLGRLEEAEPHQRRVLAGEEKIFGPEHPYVALDCHHLGHTLTLGGKLDEARRLIGRSIAILDGHPNFEPFRLGFARWRLAQWHEASGDRAEARRSGAQALEILTRTKGEAHRETAQIREWLGSLRAD